MASSAVAQAVSFSGVGIHSGKVATLTVQPKDSGGVRFRRIDLAGSDDILACADTVCDTRRSTTLGSGVASVSTVEHLLAALWASGIHNCLVEIDGPEIPILDGSARVFMDGFKALPQKTAPRRKLKQPVSYTDGDVVLVALPYDGFKISYTLSFLQDYVPDQFASFEEGKNCFYTEFSGARTFALEEEVMALRALGLGLGGSLENAIVLGPSGMQVAGGLRFRNELARHKLLDVVGDLALLGPIKAQIVAIRSGHRSHVAFGKKILAALEDNS